MYQQVVQTGASCSGSDDPYIDLNGNPSTISLLAYTMYQQDGVTTTHCTSVAAGSATNNRYKYTFTAPSTAGTYIIVTSAGTDDTSRSVAGRVVGVFTVTGTGYQSVDLETWLGTTPNALNGGNVQVYAAPIATAVWQDLYTSSDCTTANSMGWIMGLLYTNVYSTITTISPSGQACLNVNVLGWGGSSALPAHFTSLMIDTYGYMKISGGTGTGQINLSAGNVPAIDPGGGNAGAAAAVTAYAAADGAGSTSRDAQLYAASEGSGGGSTNASDFTGSFSATVLEKCAHRRRWQRAQQVAQETTKTGGTVWHVSPTGDDSPATDFRGRRPTKQRQSRRLAQATRFCLARAVSRSRPGLHRPRAARLLAQASRSRP